MQRQLVPGESSPARPRPPPAVATFSFYFVCVWHISRGVCGRARFARDTSPRSCVCMQLALFWGLRCWDLKAVWGQEVVGGFDR